MNTFINKWFEEWLWALCMSEDRKGNPYAFLPWFMVSRTTNSFAVRTWWDMRWMLYKTLHHINIGEVMLWTPKRKIVYVNVSDL